MQITYHIAHDILTRIFVRNVLAQVPFSLRCDRGCSHGKTATFQSAKVVGASRSSRPQTATFSSSTTSGTRPSAGTGSSGCCGSSSRACCRQHLVGRLSSRRYSGAGCGQRRFEVVPFHTSDRRCASTRPQDSRGGWARRSLQSARRDVQQSVQTPASVPCWA